MNKLPVFVINLKKDVERLGWFQREMAEKWTGQPFEVIEGIVGQEISDEEIGVLVDMPQVRRLNGRDSTRAEVGLILSIQYIYQRMSKENIPVAVVFEDDVRLGRRLSQEINVLVHWLETRKDSPTVLVLSEANKYRRWQARRVQGTTVRIMKPLVIYGAYGYLLNQMAAQALLKANRPITRFADDWMGFKKNVKLDVFSVLPHLVGNNDFDRRHSNLSQERACIHAKMLQERKKPSLCTRGVNFVIRRWIPFWDFITGVSVVHERTNKAIE